MHDIIITSVIQSERNRLNIGNNRPEGGPTLQRAIQGLFSRIFRGRAGAPRRDNLEERANTPVLHTNCKCHRAS